MKRRAPIRSSPRVSRPFRFASGPEPGACGFDVRDRCQRTQWGSNRVVLFLHTFHYRHEPFSGACPQEVVSVLPCRPDSRSSPRPPALTARSNGNPTRGEPTAFRATSREQTAERLPLERLGLRSFLFAIRGGRLPCLPAKRLREGRGPPVSRCVRHFGYGLGPPLGAGSSPSRFDDV